MLASTFFRSRALRSACLTLVVVTGASAGGCATAYPHTSLDTAPTTAATYDKRAAYFKRAAPNGYDEESVVLRDGTVVYHAEDLLPAVDAASTTATAIHKTTTLREELAPKELAVWGPGIGLIGVGSAVALGSLFVPVLIAPELSKETGAPTAMMIGGTVGIATVVVGLGWGFIGQSLFLDEQERALNDANVAAITTYGQSLSERVGIVPDGNGRLVDTAKADIKEGNDDDAKPPQGASL